MSFFPLHEVFVPPESLSVSFTEMSVLAVRCFLTYLLPVRCVVVTEVVSLSMVRLSLVQRTVGAGWASTSTLNSTV